jgi:hypothetical protein
MREKEKEVIMHFVIEKKHYLCIQKKVSKQ